MDTQIPQVDTGHQTKVASDLSQNYDAEDIDRLFSRLEELVSELPAMQEKNQQLTQAREARELQTLARQANLLEEELSGYQKIQDKAMLDAKKAHENEDTATEDSSFAVLRMFSELHASRLATLQRAQNALRIALEQGSYTLDDPLEDYMLDDEDYAALEKSVQQYQTEYLAVYEACKSIEEV